MTLVSGCDPVHDFKVVMAELASFAKDLANKPMMVVATNLNAAQDASFPDKV